MKNIVMTLCSLLLLWHISSFAKTSFIFAPGILESERYAAYYCPEYHASTGETVTAATGIHVMHNPTACNFPEISLGYAHNIPEKPASFISQILTALQSYRRSQVDIKNQTSISPTPPQQKHTVKNISLDITRLHFGQKEDIAAFSRLYDAHCAKYPTGAIVLYGFSRGAATIFNFLATEYVYKKDQRVVACVLEACYDALPLPSLVPFTLFNAIFPGYDYYGTQPIDVVKKFPHDIPVLFVTSAGDTRVPKTRTSHLCIQLYAAGHRKVHFIELAHAEHPNYTNHNKKDAQLYESAVHGFYDLYDIIM